MRIREGSVVTRREPWSLLSVSRVEGDAGGDWHTRPWVRLTTCGQRSGILRIRSNSKSAMRQELFQGFAPHGDIDVMCCRDHKRDDILGRVSNDTLELSEDNEGLQFNVRLNPDDPQAVRIFAQVKRQDIKGASTRFKVDKSKH